ncbi:MAG: helix-turn-helix domain-containing protein [Nitrospinota bacterium]|nr:helix-turn-helix domain-containing protein [Nitrospinota bacterium]
MLTTAEAAKLLSISSALLIKFRLQGGGPRFYKLGRAVRYKTEDLATWLSENERSSTSDIREGKGAPNVY